MADDEKLDLQNFGATFKGFMEHVTAQAPKQESIFLTRLRAHFQTDPATLPIVVEKFSKADHPNLQVALDAYLAEGGRTADVVGVSAAEARFMGISLSDLASQSAGLMGGRGAQVGPVHYTNVRLADDTVLSCISLGLVLVTGDRPIALLVSAGRDIGISTNDVSVEVMGKTKEDADRFLADLRARLRAKSVYRGHVISLFGGSGNTIEVKFHRLPKVSREDIILPEDVLARVERSTVRFSEHKEALLAAKRHLKRGVLLYGPPGTGKTLTAMHLAGRMSDRTVVLLTGRTQGLLQQSCAMARLLQPSTVVLEDVDLIAEERSRQQCGVLLFDLLNEMDGLAEDADVLFLLTTNRPDILEPALAARPGRVDQAIEIPLPDAECRRRLVRLYGQGLTLELTRPEALIDRTQGVSAAFMRELLRRAAALAAEDGVPIVVRDRHVDDALRDLLVAGGEVLRNLFGVRPA